MFQRSLCVFGWGFVVSLAACGGGTPEAKAPAEPAAAEPAKPAEPTEPAADEPAAKKAEPAKAESKPASDGMTITRTPKDIITADGVLFSFNFSASDAFAAAEKKCDEKSGDDPKKRASCMTKARDAQVDGDSMVFRQETDGTWSWITLTRAGQKLTVLHKIQFEIGDETEKSVTLKLIGRDKGTKPMGNVPKLLVVQVPNDSEIALDDPKHGKMVYQLKAGVIGDPGR